MKNLREKNPPSTEHEDFEWLRGMPKSTRIETNKQWLKLKEKLDAGYYDISFCFWGALGRITKPDSNAPGNVFYIKFNKPEAKKVFECFDFSELNVVSAGAPQLTSDDLIRLYDISKEKLNK